MHIISKYKDYYDYLQGVYGIDEKLVLDRRGFSTIPYIPSDNTIDRLFIGEYQVEVFWKGGQPYVGESIEQFDVESNRLKIHYYTRPYATQEDKRLYYTVPSSIKGRDAHILKRPLFLGDKCPTWKEDCPILKQEWKNEYVKFPILKKYGIQKVFSPSDMWVVLTDWLSERVSKNEPNVPIGDDKIRILNAGFDLKTSFRNSK